MEPFVCEFKARRDGHLKFQCQKICYDNWSVCYDHLPEQFKKLCEPCKKPVVEIIVSSEEKKKRSPCQWMMRGQRKGQVCGKMVIGDYCAIHAKLAEKAKNNSKQCVFVFKIGPKKGNRCEVNTSNENGLCSKHKIREPAKESAQEVYKNLHKEVFGDLPSDDDSGADSDGNMSVDNELANISFKDDGEFD